MLKCITKTGSIKDKKFRKRNKNQRKGNFQLLSLLGNYMCISFTVKLMMLSLNVDFCGCSKTFCNAFVKSVYFKISSCQYIYIYIYITAEVYWFNECIRNCFTAAAKVDYSIWAHVDFNTGLFRRPTKSWSTHQLNSIHTEASQRLTQQHDRVTYFCGCHDNTVIFRELL